MTFAILDAAGQLQQLNQLPPLGQAIGASSLPVVLPSDTPLPFPKPSAPVVSTVAESSHLLKATAGNILSLSVTIGAVSGWVMLFDAITAPANGAVTPKWWAYVASDGVGGNMPKLPDIPLIFTVGIMAVFSSTGPFTKTSSATASFSAQVI